MEKLRFLIPIDDGMAISSVTYGDQEKSSQPQTVKHESRSTNLASRSAWRSDPERFSMEAPTPWRDLDQRGELGKSSTHTHLPPNSSFSQALLGSGWGRSLCHCAYAGANSIFSSLRPL